MMVFTRSFVGFCLFAISFNTGWFDLFSNKDNIVIANFTIEVQIPFLDILTSMPIA